MKDPVGNMLDKLRGKLATAVGKRGDIYLSDYRLLDSTSAHVLFGYDKEFGTPQIEDVQAAVARDYDGKLVPVMSTAQAHPEEGAVTVILQQVLPTRPFGDSTAMVAVASTMFIDKEMGETWSIVESDDGHKHLQRASKEPISEILSARKSRMQIQASVRGLAFGGTLSAGVPNINVGDEVKFYANSSLYNGQITKIDAQHVSIRSEKGNFQVAPEAVVALLKMSPETEKLNKAKLLDYYTKIYGREYAEMLVKDHPVD